jgi:phosphatidylinositol 4-kinase
VKALAPLQHHGHEPGERGDFQGVTEVASVTVSLVGFLEAASTYAHFWNPRERLEIIKLLREILSEQFQVAVETASSTIRNSDPSDCLLQDWRRYARRYATSGRPLGAMLLQQGFMRFVKACTSPVGTDGQIIREEALLDMYISGVGIVRHDDDDDELLLVKYSVETIVDEIHLLEDGSDYLQLGSTWQQRLAFSVKAFALVSFLNCIVLDEDSADPNILLSWLEDTLTDAEQMASHELAMVTLKGMAALARLSPPSASSLARSLLRFIVQNGQSDAPVVAAARCLADILRLLSQDTVIGTLYSLGNVLSSGPSPEKTHQLSALTADVGIGYSRLLEPYPQPPNGSFISLTSNGEEETSITHRNVIHAIVTIATSCNDSKIIALAQSMLLQKIGKISVAVDAYIVQETAALALSSDPMEFQLLLKFYSRLHRDGVAQNNNLILHAVGIWTHFQTLLL